MRILTMLTFLICLSACGDARGSGTVFISEQNGPNGERCYVFWNDGRPFAGHCR